MLLRILLTVAILAGIGAGVGAYLEVSNQIPTLTKQRDDEHTAKVSEITAHTKTKGELKKTQGELAQTKQELADTKSERDKAIARADAQEKRATDLADKLAKATSERDDAQNMLAAYKASGLSPDQVIKLNDTIKQSQAQIDALKGEMTVLNRTLQAKVARLSMYEDPVKHYIELPAGLKGKVIVVDPKWDFVVLNVGNDQNVQEDAEMLVSRDGHLVAKVVIRSVQKDRCIANIVPGWKIGDLYEGDDVIPAHPASS